MQQSGGLEESSSAAAAAMATRGAEDKAFRAAAVDVEDEGSVHDELLSYADLHETEADEQRDDEHEHSHDDDGADGDESWRFVGADGDRRDDAHDSEHHDGEEDPYDDDSHAHDADAYGDVSDDYDDREEGEYEQDDEEEDEEEEEDDDLVHRSWSTEKEPLSVISTVMVDNGDYRDEDEYQASAQHDSSFQAFLDESGVAGGYREAAGGHEEGEEEYEDDDDQGESTDEELLAFQFRGERAMQWTSDSKSEDADFLSRRRSAVVAPAPTQQSMDRVEASVRAALSILNGGDGSDHGSHSDGEQDASGDEDEEAGEQGSGSGEHEGEDQEEWRVGYGDDGKPFYYDIVHEAMEARWSVETPAGGANVSETERDVSQSFDGYSDNQKEQDHEAVDGHGGVVAGDLSSCRDVSEVHDEDDEEDDVYEDDEHDDNDGGESDDEYGDGENQEGEGASRFDTSQTSPQQQKAQLQRSNFTLSNFSTVTEGEDEWQEAYTAKGRVYYYNRRTRESSWKKPENYVSRQPQKQLAFSSSFSSSRGVDNNNFATASFYSSAASVNGDSSSRRASLFQSPETQDFLFCSFCGAKSVGSEAIATHFKSCSAQKFHRENKTELYAKFEELLCLMSEDATLRSLHYASSFPSAKPVEISQSALSSYRERESKRQASIQDSLLLLRRQTHAAVLQDDRQRGRRRASHGSERREVAVAEERAAVSSRTNQASSASVRSSESSSSRRKTSVGSASEAQSSTRSNISSSNSSARGLQRQQSATSGSYYLETETCRYCGRSFAEGRLAKHEAVCPRVFGNEGSWGRGMAPLNSTATTPRSASGSASPYAKSRPGSALLRKQKSKATPVEKRNLVLSFKEHQATLVGCPVCKRKFAPSGAQQHIDICKSVQNRPRNPVRLMKDFAAAG